MHGDTMATINADGALVSTHMTGPFGETLPNQTTPQNATDDTSYGYVGTHQKMSESSLAIQPIQMGARVYIPELGRFLQVDPIEGGTLNSYVYALDPVNQRDTNGKFVETALDVASVAYDAEQMRQDPSLMNAGMLAWSIVAVMIPFIPGSYTAKAASAATKYVTKVFEPVVSKIVPKTVPSAIKISVHAEERMTQRGITKAMVNKALSVGVKYNDIQNPNTVAYIVREGMASGKTLQIVTNRQSDTLVTAMIRRTFNPGNRWF